MTAERCAAQLLCGDRAGSPEEVARRLLAIQAQDPRGVRLAVRARSAGLSASDVDSAYRACRKYAINVQGGPPAPTEAQLRAALALAHCMRTHGFPQFPDPLATVPNQRSLTLGQGMYFPINSTIDFQTPPPAFVHAVRTCGVQL